MHKLHMTPSHNTNGFLDAVHATADQRRIASLLCVAVPFMIVPGNENETDSDWT
jgi:hypothetical protein